ncbi:hypothetical protein OPV22_002099 [Ensete ventricosum]|uniref:Isopenicillin N synthase-like Fe(2+) 2OG dioxygenase domain-containing protein n=1 Tax=Ensete ventricosum TaxID=4639 RepID=A0AAV8RWZ2_ENSVE|nr:hypothetical protein OPV22_002099 [Ensete ventricosum]
MAKPSFQRLGTSIHDVLIANIGDIIEIINSTQTSQINILLHRCLPWAERRFGGWSSCGDREGRQAEVCVDELRRVHENLLLRKTGREEAHGKPQAIEASNGRKFMKSVAATLLELMAKNLGVAPEFSTIFQDRPQGVNDVERLHIKKGGKWFPVKPLPDARIANIGDIIEILSNSVYKSAEHRAIINVKEERFSIAAFRGPREDSVVGPLAEIVKGGKPKYVSMSYGEFMKTYFSAKLEGRRLMESLKL